MADLQLPVLRYKPEFGDKTDFGIGIVGAGGIVDAAHLPAYQKAKFHIVGVYDPDLERAKKLANKFSITKVYGDLKELLDDRAIEIVDIAVPPVFQHDIAVQALQAGKHLLCQKPLHDSFATAARIVHAAESAGCKLAVNENMRWDPAMRASRQLIAEGWIGEPTMATLDINYREDWTIWPWLGSSERLVIMFRRDPSSLFVAHAFWQSYRSVFDDREDARTERTRRDTGGHHIGVRQRRDRHAAGFIH